MAFSGNKEFQAAELAGQTWTSSFRKVSALATTQGLWFDGSMSSGNPKPNYYATAEKESAVLSQNNGIWHGGNVSPLRKYLHKILIASLAAGVTPATFIFCDFLLYYPLIDMDDTSSQDLTTTITLPRYTSGDGVQMYLVATNPYIGGQTFFVTYTNSEGVANRVTKAILTNTGTNIGTIVNAGTTGAAAVSWFIPLQHGDKGVQSVQNIEFQGPNGGLATLVLVKPLGNITTREITAFTERDFFLDNAGNPAHIEDGAYINYICQPNGSALSVPVIGDLSVVWV